MHALDAEMTIRHVAVLLTLATLYACTGRPVHGAAAPEPPQPLDGLVRGQPVVVYQGDGPPPGMVRDASLDHCVLDIAMDKGVLHDREQGWITVLSFARPVSVLRLCVEPPPEATRSERLWSRWTMYMDGYDGSSARVGATCQVYQPAASVPAQEETSIVAHSDLHKLPLTRLWVQGRCPAVMMGRGRITAQHLYRGYR